MKVYITARFQGKQHQPEVEKLCAAVRDAEMKDFCFVRDVEHIDDPKELWQRAYDEIAACEALLIDVTDKPTGGRMVEAGIAFALKKRIFVVMRRGTQYNGLFDGISSTVIEYESYADITKALKKYHIDSSFNITDKAILFAMLLGFGLAVSWGMAQLEMLLGIVVAIGYWMLVRWIIKPMRAFDRVIIYVPLIGIWAAGIYLLLPLNYLFAFAWAISFWFVALLALQKMKFSI